jgi:hypothetical protein
MEQAFERVGETEDILTDNLEMEREGSHHKKEVD